VRLCAKKTSAGYRITFRKTFEESVQTLLLSLLMTLSTQGPFYFVFRLPVEAITLISRKLQWRSVYYTGALFSRR
jgi:hypothetical protein